jgi:hypothetical protein
VRRSVERILTTHCGSLPHSAEVVEVVARMEQDDPIDVERYE